MSDLKRLYDMVLCVVLGISAQITALPATEHRVNLRLVTKRFLFGI